MFQEPFIHVETEVLLAPQHPGQRLAHDAGAIFADTFRRDGAIKLVSLALATLHHFAEAVEGIAHVGRRPVTEAQTDRGSLPCSHIDLIVGGRFCPGVLRVDSILLAVDYVVVDPVFDVGSPVGRAEYPLVVGLILGKEQRDVSVTVQVALAEKVV